MHLEKPYGRLAGVNSKEEAGAAASAKTGKYSRAVLREE